MNNDYIENVKEKIIKYNKKIDNFKELEKVYSKTIINGLDAYNFIKDKNRNSNVFIMTRYMDEKITDEFKSIVSMLSRVPDTVLLNGENIAAVTKYKKRLEEIIQSEYENIKRLATSEKIKEINNVFKELDKIGNQTNINIKMIKVVMQKVGFTNEEIIDFLCYIGKENSKIYINRIEKINQESLKRTAEHEQREEKRRVRREKRNLKAKCLKNFCSDKSKDLFNEVDEVLNSNKVDNDPALNEYALSYMNIFINPKEKLSNYFQNKDELSNLLLIALKKKKEEIDDYSEDFTEEDLKLDIDELRTVLDNYNNSKIVVKKTNTPKYEDNVQKNLYYLVNENNNKKYIQISIDGNKEKTFKNSVNVAINKIQNGLNKHRLKPIKDVPSGYFIKQNKVFVGCIEVNDDNYIIITAAKRDDFYSLVNNIIEQNEEQIKRIKDKVLQRSAGVR